jgi:hypothetical protein
VTSACRPRGGQRPRHRIPRHTGIAAGDCIGIQARHRRQPPRDRPRRQPRFAVGESDHRPITTLISQKLDYVSRCHRHRLLRHDREERLQIERHRPQRVRPSPPSHKLQIPIHQRITEPIPRLSRHSCQAHQIRKTRHDRTLAATQ